jgi:endonuclease-8
VPEGDAVWNTAKRLHAALAGQVLTRSDFRVPRYATVSLTGQLVTEAVAHGKHLLIRTDRGLTVHTHLKMDGYWRIQPADGGRPFGRSHQLRLVLGNAQWLAAGYLLGITEVLPTAREDQVTGHLGPDLLGPDWDAELALANLRREPAVAIGEALLDQRNLAGIGNLYANELCFLAGSHPRLPVSEVPDLHRLVRRAKSALEANKERAQQTMTGDLRAGQQHYVYRRDNKQCRRCGSVIRVETQGPEGRERSAYWCPQCQPEPTSTAG